MYKYKKWEKVDSKQVYNSEYLKVYNDRIRLPNNSIINYDWFLSPDFCVMIPTLNKKFVMIENYRYPADTWSLEFPAGHIKEGESPDKAAIRELLEETGYEASNIKFLGWYYVSSRTLQRGHVFLCNELKKSKTKREPSELQRIKIVSSEYIEKAIKNNVITHAATLIAYTMYKMRLSQQK